MSVGPKRLYSDPSDDTLTPRVSLFSSLSHYKRRRSSQMPNSSLTSLPNTSMIGETSPQSSTAQPLASRISNALAGRLMPGVLLNPVPGSQPRADKSISSLRASNRLSSSLSRITESFSGDSSLQSKGFAIIGNKNLRGGLARQQTKPPPPDVMFLKMSLLQNYRNAIAEREKKLMAEFDLKSEKELSARLKRIEIEQQAEEEKESAAAEDEVVLTEEQRQVVQRYFGAARSNPHGVVVDAFKIELTYADLATLQPRKWLNDNVIDLYLNTIAAENTNVAVFTTHFFTRLDESGYSAVRRWALRRKLDVFVPEYVFVPINQGNMHWTLAVVDNKHTRLEFYDSLPSGKGQRELDVLLTYLKEEAKRLGKSVPAYSLVPNARGPSQSNGSDCGVFVCEAVTRLARNQQLSHKQKDMPLIRDRIAYSLVQLRNTNGSKL